MLLEGGYVCFVAGTMVSTSDGLVPIEQIEAGMLVLSRDQFDPGELVWSQVVERFDLEADRVYTLTLKSADGVEDTITSTGEHPFFVEGIGWLGAEFIPINSQLRLDDDTTVELVYRTVTYAPEGEKIAVFNLHVNDSHTFYVQLPLADELLWTHNTAKNKSSPACPSNKNLAANRGQLALPGPTLGKSNAIRGNKFQQSVHESLRLPENTGKVTGITKRGPVNTEPDLLGLRSGVTDVKNVKKIYFDKQLQAQFDYSKQTGQTFNLIISPRTQSVSVPLQQAISQRGGIIVRFDDAIGSFSNVRFNRSRVVP